MAVYAREKIVQEFIVRKRFRLQCGNNIRTLRLHLEFHYIIQYTFNICYLHLHL